MSSVRIYISATLENPTGGNFYNLSGGEVVWQEITKTVLNNSLVINETYTKGNYTLGFISLSSVDLELENTEGFYFSTNNIETQHFPAGLNNSLIKIDWSVTNLGTCGGVVSGSTLTNYTKTVFYGFIDDKYSSFDSDTQILKIKVLGIVEALKRIPFYAPKESVKQNVSYYLNNSINVGYSNNNFKYSEIYKSILLLGKSTQTNNVVVEYNIENYYIETDETEEIYTNSVFDFLEEFLNIVYGIADFDAENNKLTINRSPLLNSIPNPSQIKDNPILFYGGNYGSENIISIKGGNSGASKILNRPIAEIQLSAREDNFVLSAFPVTLGANEGFITNKSSRIVFATESITINNLDEIENYFNNKKLTYDYPKWEANKNYIIAKNNWVKVDNSIYFAAISNFISSATFEQDLALNRWVLASPLIDDTANLLASISKYGQKELRSKVKNVLIDSDGVYNLKSLYNNFDLEIYEKSLEYKITAVLNIETLNVNILDLIKIYAESLVNSYENSLWDYALFDVNYFVEEISTLEININKIWVILGRKIDLINDIITFDIKEKITT